MTIKISTTGGDPSRTPIGKVKLSTETKTKVGKTQIKTAVKPVRVTVPVVRQVVTETGAPEDLDGGFF